MAKQASIKEIAALAGVSVGTVDRVIHNRGKVSEKSLKAVQDALSAVSYSNNIHSSAISYKKQIRITITTPFADSGGYWTAIWSGVDQAIKEYADMDISLSWALYNQFDIYSCREAYSSILEHEPNAVIIGPTFVEETRKLCKSLDDAGVPYFLVDAVISHTRPKATYTVDQHTCGYLMGRLLHSLVMESGELAVMEMKRVGGAHSSNTVERMKGFLQFLEDADIAGQYKCGKLSATEPDENERALLDFLHENPSVRGIAVMNSRGYIVADILRKNGIGGVKLVCFDLTENNARCLTEGSISLLLCQRPALQGFHAVRAAISWLLYRQPHKTPNHILPIDIILKENLPFYKEIFSG